MNPGAGVGKGKVLFASGIFTNQVTANVGEFEDSLIDAIDTVNENVEEASNCSKFSSLTRTKCDVCRKLLNEDKSYT